MLASQPGAATSTSGAASVAAPAATPAATADVPSTQAPEKLTLRFRCSGSDDVLLRVLPRMKWQKAINVYLDRMKLDAAACRFCYNGAVLNPASTIASYDVENEDQVDVIRL